MKFTNEYKFDTEERRELSIRHIARLVSEGCYITEIYDDEGTKTLVTFEK